eukprot:scaffold57409_cov32-Tisochrysis_lutea.AAC.1
MLLRLAARAPFDERRAAASASARRCKTARLVPSPRPPVPSVPASPRLAFEVHADFSVCASCSSSLSPSLSLALVQRWAGAHRVHAAGGSAPSHRMHSAGQPP